MPLCRHDLRRNKTSLKTLDIRSRVNTWKTMSLNSRELTAKVSHWHPRDSVAVREIHTQPPTPKSPVLHVVSQGCTNVVVNFDLFLPMNCPRRLIFHLLATLVLVTRQCELLCRNTACLTVLSKTYFEAWSEATFRY